MDSAPPYSSPSSPGSSQNNQPLSDIDFSLDHDDEDDEDLNLELAGAHRDSDQAMKLAVQELRSLEFLLSKVHKVKEEIDRVRQHLIRSTDDPCQGGGVDCPPSSPPIAAAAVTGRSFLSWLDSYINDGKDTNQDGH